MALNNNKGIIVNTFWDHNTNCATINTHHVNEPKQIPYIRHGRLIASQFSLEDIAALVDRVKVLEEAYMELALLGRKDE